MNKTQSEPFLLPQVSRAISLLLPLQDRLEDSDGRGVGVLQVSDTGADEAGGHEDEGVHQKPDAVTTHMMFFNIQKGPSIK